ncbi:hypothetical protein [Pseudonocardia endophytica]|uniref:Uncharacterized protein n=1 Tax=Pseudonocardia endophytica TaxID=401976 RepID=A0A4R1HYN8_PSEEN|nr:hypothetical protein [Pseudonocardia endophytica]TCK26275.1 hypothetical protein EV378_2104 [Pseudonocardia endophytica]
MTSEGLANGGILLVMAVALAALGLWARGNVENLVPAQMSGEQRDKRVRVLRRGGITCLVVALVFVAVAIAVAI